MQEIDQVYLDSLKEGKFDKIMLDDPVMAIVDQDIDDGREAEEDLLSGEARFDSEMIDLIDSDALDKLEDIMNDSYEE